MMELETILKEGIQANRDIFGFTTNQTTLKPYNQEQWNRFCETNNFSKTSYGLFIPKGMKAYVNRNSPHLIPTIFHEFQGHGNYAEHSSLGQEIVNHSKDNTLEQHLTEDRDEGILSKSVEDYEGYATWVEEKISNHTGHQKEWDKTREELNNWYLQVLDVFKDVERKITELGVLGELYMPKMYDSEDLRKLVQNIHPKPENISFALHYGSGKPKEDIDLFIVGHVETQTITNNWLDIYQLDTETFDHKREHLDISVTDPLQTGTHIYGSKNAFQQTKQEIEEQDITRSAIQHNRKMYEEHRNILPTLDDERERENCKSYIKTYKQHAIELQKGNKILTKEELTNEP